MSTYLERTRRFGESIGAKAIRTERLSLLGTRTVDRLIIAGMGGSGLAGDLAAHFRSEAGIPVPIAVWKDYGLPATRAKRPFFIFVSFSGVPAETVSGLTAALRIRPRPLIAVVTARPNGPLGTIAEREKLPLATFPAGDLTPREAIGYAWSAVSKLLHAQFPAVAGPQPLRGLALGSEERLGRTLARALKGTIPLVYTDHAFHAVGYIWKICLNETGKTPAFAATFPELDHNEIAGFETKLARFTAVVLEDPKARRELKDTIARAVRTFKKAGVAVIRVPLRGKDFTERTWRGIALAHFTSYFLATGNHKDPVQTKVIEYLKSLAR